VLENAGSTQRREQDARARALLARVRGINARGMFCYCWAGNAVPPADSTHMPQDKDEASRESVHADNLKHPLPHSCLCGWDKYTSCMARYM
jgi:hypothetical protein